MKKSVITMGLLLCAAAAGAKETGTHFAQEALQKYLDSGEIPGAVTIFCKGDLEETACLGYANVEEKRPITLDTIFQQCSQTKGFCGVSAAMLIEAGKIGLDDPVGKYLPEFNGPFWVETVKTNGVRVLVQAKSPITVRMCLTHTSGLPFELPNMEAMGGWSRRMPLRSAAATAAALPLLFEPGAKVQYSNIGIDVAAAVVEKVSGMRWEDFLEQRLFRPLGMASSTFKPSDEQLAKRMCIYRIRPGKKAEYVAEKSAMQAPFNDDRVFASAGAGLWTTARDQLKFYRMLMNLGLGDNGVRILKEETVKKLLAVSQRPKGISSDGYSFGMVAPWEDGDDQFFGHGGAWVSQCLVNWHRKELRLLAVQFDGGYYFRDIAAKAAERFFSHKVDDKAVNAYTGRMK